MKEIPYNRYLYYYLRTCPNMNRSMRKHELLYWDIVHNKNYYISSKVVLKFINYDRRTNRTKCKDVC